MAPWKRKNMGTKKMKNGPIDRYFDCSKLLRCLRTEDRVVRDFDEEVDITAVVDWLPIVCVTASHRAEVEMKERTQGTAYQCG